MCVYFEVTQNYFLSQNIFLLKKFDICIETMAAANFSRDVLEMFYGPIPQDVQQRLSIPIRPSRSFDFEIVKSNFGEWLCVILWQMRVLGGNRDLLKFVQKTKNRFIDVCENELRTLKIRIKRDFLKHKTIKVRDNKLNRRFGVDITPLSR